LEGKNPCTGEGGGVPTHTKICGHKQEFCFFSPKKGKNEQLLGGPKKWGTLVVVKWLEKKSLTPSGCKEKIVDNPCARPSGVEREKGGTGKKNKNQGKGSKKLDGAERGKIGVTIGGVFVVMGKRGKRFV